MSSRRQRNRESRRQGDPTFPSAYRPSPSSPKPTSFTNLPESSDQESSPEKNGVVGLLKTSPEGGRNRKSSKGLRVTFDLSKGKEDEVVECWEDISDGDGESGPGDFVIKDEDLIDCETEFMDFSHELMTLDDDVVPTAGTEDISISSSSSSSLSQDVKHLPTFNRNSREKTLTPTEDENNLQEVPTQKEIGALSLNTSGQQQETINVQNYGNEEGIRYSDLGVEIIKPVEIDSGEMSGSASSNDVRSDELGFDYINVIPYIDGVEDDDDEWETEPSGSSNSQENDQLRAMASGHEMSSPKKDSDEHDGVTEVDQPSLEEEEEQGDVESDDLISKADIDAVFQALMRDQYETPPPEEFADESNVCRNTVTYEIFEGEPVSSRNGSGASEDGESVVRDDLQDLPPGVADEASPSSMTPSLMADPLKVSCEVSESVNGAAAEVPKHLHVTSKIPKPVLVSADFPDSSLVTSETPQTSRITAEVPDHLRGTSRIPKPLSIIPEVSQPSSVTPEMPDSSSVTTAVPDSSVVLTADVPVPEVSETLLFPTEVSSPLEEVSEPLCFITKAPAPLLVTTDDTPEIPLTFSETALSVEGDEETSFDSKHDSLPPSTDVCLESPVATCESVSLCIDENIRMVTVPEKPDSPQVTIGFECRDRKAGSIYSSETESEGELVPCEDKCIGTADSDLYEDQDEPLDLSNSERTFSKSETETSESQDSLGGSCEGECQEEQLNLAPSADKYTPVASADNSLYISDIRLEDATPSPDIIDDGKCIGKSESNKEKEKINGKKVGKKKGKKNKRDVKVEAAANAEHSLDRPKLVRGRAWKEKRENFKNQRPEPIALSFGKELCEPEMIEGTSNLETEAYTENSLLAAAAKCSSDDSNVTKAPCSVCSSVTSDITEFSSAEICVCEGKRQETVDSAGQMETKGSDVIPSASLLSPGVSIEVTGASDDDNSDDEPAYREPPDKEDFFIVKPCEVAAPSKVRTEYVADTESSLEESSDASTGSAEDRESGNFVTIEGINSELTRASSDVSSGVIINNPNVPGIHNNMPVSSCDAENPLYVDAKDSSCVDTLSQSFDYVESFPSVIGTQSLSLVYSYDNLDSDFESPSGPRRVLQGQPSSHNVSDHSARSTLAMSDTMIVNAGSGRRKGKPSPPNSGDLVYEGPCMCAAEVSELSEEQSLPLSTRGGERESMGEDDHLCVPPLFESEQEYLGMGEEVKTDDEPLGTSAYRNSLNESMGSNSEDLAEEHEGESKDIRSRIKEIVGPRLQRERGRPMTLRKRRVAMETGEDGGDGGRDDSPLPGSSPASSSGVQGSDEMSPSRSRSCSPAREESVSPTSTTYNVPDLAYESYQVQVQDLTPEKLERDPTECLRVLRFEGSMDSSPEKGNQVDCSFRTFRDMYQINPIYLTDSEEQEELNESDTIQGSSVSLSYDPDRPITVSSWGSTSEESPVTQDHLSSSPPLPDSRPSSRKVPKVTKLLKETQGIVQRWEVLQAQAVERQRQSGQVRDLQRQVKALRLALEKLTDRANDLGQGEEIEIHKDLTHKLSQAKELLDEVNERKVEVSGVNLAVHRFLTETGYSLTPLKDDVADLYRLWDEAHRRVSSEVSRLESVEATWKLWEAQAEELTRALRQDGDTLKVLDAAIQTGSLNDSVTASVQDVARLLNERRRTSPGKKLMLQHTRTQGVDIQGSSTSSTLSLGGSGDECLSDSGTSGYESCSSEELSERERRLAHLRRLARDLEASLHPNSQAWAAITKTLSSAESELKGLQKHCRELVVRSAETLDQAKSSPQLRRRSWVKDSKAGRSSRGDRRVGVSARDSCGRSNGRRGWMWRVVRAALPFQAALLLLFCVACLLEPNCCDHVNTLNLSLSPQLRYVHGPPPV